jgi:hypothetical protein
MSEEVNGDTAEPYRDGTQPVVSADGSRLLARWGLLKDYDRMKAQR